MPLPLGQVPLRLPLFIALAGLAMGLPRTLVQTAGAGMFLAHFPAQGIAWIYLATALVCPLVALLFLRVESRLPLVPMLIGVQVVSAAVSIVLGLAYRVEPQTVAALSFLWAQIENMTSSLVFWGLANQYFAISQARREFARIGAGEQFGALAVGLLIPLSLTLVGTSDLLFVSAFSNMGAALLIAWIHRRLSPAALSTSKSEGAARPETLNRRVKTFIAAIFATTLFANLAFFVIDNSFYIETQVHFADGDAATAFIGLTLASAAGLSLLLSSTIAPLIMSRLGVAKIMPILPGVLLMLALAILGAHWGLGTGMGLVFGLVVAMKVLDESLRLCLYRPAAQALFQPLPASARFRAQTLSEGFVEPSGIALAALFLLLAGLVPGIGAAEIALVLVPVLALWCAATLFVGRRYRHALELAVTGRQTLDPAAPVFAGPDAIALLVKRATTLGPDEASPLLPIIRTRDPAAYRDLLPGLIALANTRVDIFIFSHPQDFADLGVGSQLARRLDDADARLRPMLLAALAASGDHNSGLAIEAFRPRSHTEYLARAKALIAVHGPAGIGAQNTFLLDLQDPRPQVRCDALQVLVEAKTPEVAAAVADCFEDADPTVRHLAYTLAPTLGAPALLRKLAHKLNDPACPPQDRPAILSSCAGFGAAGVDSLKSALSAGHSELKRLSISAVARVDIPAAQSLLIEAALAVSPPIALAAVAHLWERALVLEARPAQGRIQTLIEEAVQLVQATKIIAGRDTRGLAVAALRHEARLRLELALGLAVLADGGLVHRRPAFASLMRFGAENRGYANEHFELALPAKLRPAALLAMSSAHSPAEAKRLAAMAPAVPQDGVLCVTWLRTNGMAMSEWAGLCLTELATANVEEKEHGPMNVFEKVLVLKSVDLFADIEDVYLAEFAPVIEEVFLEPGQTLIAAGSTGTTLYIVVNGVLGVERDGQEIARMGRFGVAGELAAFDPQPRSADVIAREPCHVLALSQVHLETLIASHMDIATSIIRSVSRRLRVALGG